MNFNTINTELSTLTTNIKETTNTRNQGIKACLSEIETKLSELNNDGLKGRKARKSAKQSILGDIGTISKELNRAYTIAFTIVFRDLSIHVDKLTIAQIENLSKHGAVNEINELFKNEDTYSSDVSDYLKSLKTRIVETKTFEKLDNKR